MTAGLYCGLLSANFMADQDVETISCPIGKWYFKRMSLLGLLLIGFGCWFLYDAVIGYPKGSVKAVINEAFKAGASTSWEAYASDPNTNFAKVELDEEQLDSVRAAHAEGGKKTTWEDFARKMKIELSVPPEGAENRDLFDAFTAGGSEGADWAEFAAANGLAEQPTAVEERNDRAGALYNAFEDAGKPRDWPLYAAANGLPSKDPHFHGKGDIFEQYLIGALCSAGGLVALGLLLLNRDRSVTADRVAYFPKPNIKVPYADVFKIDTRKWRRKGLAYVHYRDGSDDERKAVIDDLKFVGSQAILDRMVDNFEGELIEEVIEEDEAGESAGAELNDAGDAESDKG